MEVAPGIEQRKLRRIAVQWGPQEQRYRLLVPFFDVGYKVLGIVGVDGGLQVTWFPGAPWKVKGRRIAYKAQGRDAPPPWSDVPAELLQSAWFYDPTGAVSLMVPRQPGAPSLAGAVNLAGTSLRGRRVQDIVYEPALHRVRALALRGRWSRVQRVSVMRIGPLPRGLPAAAPAMGPASAPAASPPGPARAPQGPSPAPVAAPGMELGAEPGPRTEGQTARGNLDAGGRGAEETLNRLLRQFEPMPPE